VRIYVSYSQYEIKMKNLKSLIDKQYQYLSRDNITVKNKCNILNNIIELKLKNESYKNSGQQISKDFKLYFKNLVLLEEDTSTLYDSIKLNKIKDQLKKVEFNQQLDLLRYFKRKLKIAGYESYYSSVAEIEYDLKIDFYKNKWYHPKNLYNLILTYPLNGLKNICICLFLTYLLFSLFTLPAFHDSLGLFDIEYHKYSNNYIINHFANTLGFLFGFDSDFSITPVNVLALLLSIAVKAIFIIVVLNVLINKALDYIKQ